LAKMVKAVIEPSNRSNTLKTSQLALETFPEAVIMVDTAGMVVLANAIARKVFKLSVGSDFSAGNPFGLWGVCEAVRVSKVATMMSGYHHSILSNADEKEAWYLPVVVPVFRGGDEVQAFTLLLRDVTEWRRLDGMKSDLLSVVSKELRPSLTSLRLSAHLLLEDRLGPLTSEQSDLIQTTKDEADKLDGIFSQLLEMAQFGTGQINIVRKSESVETLLNLALERFATAFRERGIALEVRLAADLPNVLADSDALQEVLGHLLDNALRLTPSGGEVSLSGMMENEDVKIAVTDSGPGIAPEDLSHIFERFCHIASSKKQGAGLGLAICREIIEAHEGVISVTSKINEGSVFVFTLKKAE
jgi:signal transduction histidine kinase